MKTGRNLFQIGLLCAALLPVVVQAQSYIYTTNNGAITITGYTGPLGNVIIPSIINDYPVTAIGPNIFHSAAGLTGVVIPDSVTSIAGAFSDCNNLTSVTIGSGVTSIGSSTFYRCFSLKSVTIPNSVSSIGINAFYGCSGLKSVTIGSGVTSIGDYAFYACSGLTNIAVDAANPSYASAGGVLFDKTLTTLIEFPQNLSGSYTIPNSVTSIGSYAFHGSGLTNVTIPNSVTSIGYYAFSYSGLTSLTIPNSITSVGNEVFERCDQLTSVTIPNSVTSIGHLAFDGCTGLTSVTIPNSVTSIGAGAFNYCTGLTNLTIGTSVSSIDNSAFYGCTGLTSVTIPDSVTSIGQEAFERCTKLTSVTIPNSVTSIAYGLFSQCSSLTSVTIPNSVTSIGSYAFNFCGLTNVTIGTSVTSIGNYAFYVCPGLKTVCFLGNAPGEGTDSTVFSGDNTAIVFYLQGTTGWGLTFDGRPTALWFLPNPVILNNSTSFGVQSGQFGFTISWKRNISVVVEGCTNLVNPVWTPVTTNALRNGTNYFSDPQWTNYTGRFYRIRSP